MKIVKNNIISQELIDEVANKHKHDKFENVLITTGIIVLGIASISITVVGYTIWNTLV